MSNNNEAIIELRAEINTLKEWISSANNVNPSSLVVAISNYLDEIEDYLSNREISKIKLDEYSFGIFRQVTDDYQLEQSPLGKGLLNLSVKILELSKKF